MIKMIKYIRLRKIIKEESNRIMLAERDFEDREVLCDIEAFKQASQKMFDLYKGKINQVIYDFDMWEESHNSLDKVIDFLELKQVDLEESDDGYDFYMVKFIR